MLWNSNVLFGLLLCHVSHISGPSSWLLQPFFRSISSCWPFHNGQLVLFLLPLACCISSPLFSDWLAPSGCFLYGLEPPIFAISLRVRHSRPKPKSTLHLGHKIASIHWTVHCVHLSQDSMQAMCHGILLTEVRNEDPPDLQCFRSRSCFWQQCRCTET